MTARMGVLWGKRCVRIRRIRRLAESILAMEVLDPWRTCRFWSSKKIRVFATIDGET